MAHPQRQADRDSFFFFFLFELRKIEIKIKHMLSYHAIIHLPILLCLHSLSAPNIHVYQDLFLFLIFIPISRPQSQKQSRAFPTIFPIPSSWQIRNVRIRCQRLRNVLTSLNPSNHNQPVSGLGHGFANDVRTFGLALCADHVSLAFLLSLFDNEAGPLGVLLGDLLLFDCAGEFFAECHVCDGDVFELDVEFGCAFKQVGADPGGD